MFGDRRVIRKLRMFLADRSGATALEYAIITGLVIAAALVAITPAGGFVTYVMGAPGSFFDQLPGILQNIYGQGK
jgi:Flp pilus assembly pilin Flp